MNDSGNRIQLLLQIIYTTTSHKLRDDTIGRTSVRYDQVPHLKELLLSFFSYFIHDRIIQLFKVKIQLTV